MEALLVVAAAVAAWFVLRARGQAARRERLRGWVETRSAALLLEFPGTPPEGIAVLVRDELLNRGERDVGVLAWAEAETVRRLVRTALVAHVREERAAERRALVDVAATPAPAPKKARKAGGELVVRLKRCERCGRQCRGDRAICDDCR